MEVRHGRGPRGAISVITDVIHKKRQSAYLFPVLLRPYV